MHLLMQRAKVRKQLHRLVALALLVVLLSGGLGVPLFSFTVKDKSQPFPCQNSPCACRDAESCWQACCCMNDEQKLAWAAQAGVTPPVYVAERVRNRTKLATVESSNAACASCCKSSQSPPSSAPPETSSSQDLTRESSEPKSAGDLQTHVVFLSAQARCQGLLDWISLFSLAVPVVAEALEVPQPGLSHPVSELQVIYFSHVAHPPVPPPRAA